MYRITAEDNVEHLVELNPKKKNKKNPKKTAAQFGAKLSFSSIFSPTLLKKERSYEIDISYQLIT